MPLVFVHRLLKQTTLESGYFLLLACLAAILIFVGLVPDLHANFDARTSLLLRSFSEVMAALIAGMVFGVGWHAYMRKRAANIVMLACAFFAVGMFDIGHMLLSVPGIAASEGSGEASISIYFWLASKLVLATSLLFFALMLWQSYKNAHMRWVMLGVGVGITGLTYWLVLSRAYWLPEGFSSGQGLFIFRVGVGYCIITLYSASLWILLRHQATTHKNLRTLSLGIAILILSEWCFISYSTPSDIYSLLGYLYRVLGYFFVYRAVFVDSVHEPFARLLVSEAHAQRERVLKQATLEAIGDGVITINTLGNIEYLNSSARKILGLTSEEAHGMPLRMAAYIVNEDTRERVAYDIGFLHANKKSDSPTRQLLLARRDGTEIPIEDTVAPLHDASGAEAGRVVILKDMTERHTVQKALSLSEHMFHELLEFAPDAIIISDSGGCIIKVNAQAEKLFGYSGEELFGQPVEVLIPQRLRSHHHHYRKNYQDQPHARPMGGSRDLFCLRKDGTEFPGDISIGPLETAQGRQVIAVVRDMTVRRLMEAQSREAAHYARSLIEASLDPLVTISVDGKITDVNRATEDVTGMPRNALIGSHFADWFTDPEKAREGYKYVFSEGDVRDWPLSILHVSGRAIDVLYNASVYLDEGGRVQGIFAAARDITERKHFEQQLTYQATHDALTGLPNRVLLQDRLQQAIAQSHRNGLSVAVMFIDLDNFKQVNDTLGHAVGDSLLRQVAQRVQARLREGDTVARFGGDEFVILLQSGTSIHDLDGIAQKLLDIIATPYDIDGQRLFANASIGITVSPLDGNDAETLLRNADTAMYVAKEAGRNDYRFFSAEMDADLHERLELENWLRQALENSEFELHYQPKANLKSGKVIGVEALLRWRHPQHGMIPPARFIPVAEECGLISGIGLWVMNEACRQARQWLDEGLNPICVAINLSAGQCRSDEVSAQIKDALTRYRLGGNLIEVEITESMVMHDTDSAICTFWELRKMGVHVTIDDFGTGYSSLSYLKRFPIESIKIDKSFVDEIETELSDREIVCAIIAMAHSLGLRVIAEGVETATQLGLLHRSGCDEIQGYYFSEPLPAAELATFLRGGQRLTLGKWQE